MYEYIVSVSVGKTNMLAMICKSEKERQREIDGDREVVAGYFILIVFNYYGVTQNLQKQQFVISIHNSNNKRIHSNRHLCALTENTKDFHLQQQQQQEIFSQYKKNGGEGGKKEQYNIMLEDLNIIKQGWEMVIFEMMMLQKGGKFTFGIT